MYTDWVNAKILQKAVLLDEEGNILLIKRSSTNEGNRPGKWDFPGGNLDANDLTIPEVRDIHIQSVKREIKEETGLIAENISFLYQQSNVGIRDVGNIFVFVIGYKCTVSGIEPEVHLSLEHESYEWIRKEQVGQYDFGSVGNFFIKCIEAL